MTIARETLLSVMEMQTVSPMETFTSVSATLVSVVMARSATVSMTLCKIFNDEPHFTAAKNTSEIYLVFKSFLCVFGENLGGLDL